MAEAAHWTKIIFGLLTAGLAGICYVSANQMPEPDRRRITLWIGVFLAADAIVLIAL